LGRGRLASHTTCTRLPSGMVLPSALKARWASQEKKKQLPVSSSQRGGVVMADFATLVMSLLCRGPRRVGSHTRSMLPSSPGAASRIRSQEKKKQLPVSPSQRGGVVMADFATLVQGSLCASAPRKEKASTGEFLSTGGVMADFATLVP